MLLIRSCCMLSFTCKDCHILKTPGTHSHPVLIYISSLGIILYLIRYTYISTLSMGLYIAVEKPPYLCTTGLCCRSEQDRLSLTTLRANRIDWYNWYVYYILRCGTGLKCLTPGGLFDGRPPWYKTYFKGVCIVDPTLTGLVPTRRTHSMA